MIEIDHVTKLFGTQRRPHRRRRRPHARRSTRARWWRSSAAPGPGKTTTLRMINRLIEPTAGTITVDGRDVSALPAHELRRGHRLRHPAGRPVPAPHGARQRRHRAPPARLGQGAGDGAGRGSCSTSSASTPASPTATRPSCRGGQQQRVGVARALAADPPVLLMDEPFGAVDPIVRAQLQREFAKLQRELGKTVVFVTHDVDEAIVLGDRIAVLETGGRLAQLDTPAELLANPASAFVADFLGGRDRRVRGRRGRRLPIEATLRPRRARSGRRRARGRRRRRSTARGA